MKLLTIEELRVLKYPVPADYSTTNDAIGALIGDAPDFVSPFFPDYNIDIGYSMALHGLESLERGALSSAQRHILESCREQLIGSYEAFLAGDKKRGFELVQAAWGSFKDIKRKRTRHQPLPDVFE